MTPAYLRAGYKNKGEAIGHILQEIIENPGCAGLDGTCSVVVLGNNYTLKPLKKKKKEEI